MLLDVTHLLTPVFAALTVLLGVSVAAIATSAVRRRRTRRRPPGLVRLDLRPPTAETARSA